MFGAFELISEIANQNQSDQKAEQIKNLGPQEVSQTKNKTKRKTK